ATPYRRMLPPAGGYASDLLRRSLRYRETERKGIAFPHCAAAKPLQPLNLLATFLCNAPRAVRPQKSAVAASLCRRTPKRSGLRPSAVSLIGGRRFFTLHV